MNLSRIRLLLILFCLAPLLAHGDVTVQNLRQWRAPDHTRLVFDLSAPLDHRVFTLTDPHRIVVDLKNAALRGALPELELSGPLLAGVRSGRPKPQTLRIVLDLKTAVRPRTFVLGPAGQYGHRLVIDLLDSEAALDRSAREPPKRRRAAPRPFAVAIDAGHGGEDPGAIGRRYRTLEKDVTLAIARELARLVDRAPGMRAVLIRDGDYYIGLRERFAKARAERADLFISIHADAVPGRQASGSSVYALSEKGATDAMAKLIAERENSSDQIGGVSLSQMDDTLAKVLLDLSQTRTIQDSLVLGGDLLAELGRIGPLHSHDVRQAGFMVLKAPDIPSVLVETAFISNPSEERKLRSRRFQRRMAQGIYKGILRYKARRPAPSPALAQSEDRSADGASTRSF